MFLPGNHQVRFSTLVGVPMGHSHDYDYYMSCRGEKEKQCIEDFKSGSIKDEGEISVQLDIGGTARYCKKLFDSTRFFYTVK